MEASRLRSLLLSGDDGIAALAGDLLVSLGYVADHAWVDERPGGSGDLEYDVAALLRRGLAQVGQASLTVRGGCMAPLIQDGDVISIRPIDSVPGLGSVVVGEVEPGLVVCHRVLRAIGNGILVIGGDRAGTVQEVSSADLIGTVSRVQRGSRSIKLRGTLHDVCAAVALVCTPALDAEQRPSESGLRVQATRRAGRLLRALLRRCGVLPGRLTWMLVGKRSRPGESQSDGSQSDGSQSSE